MKNHSDQSLIKMFAEKTSRDDAFRLIIEKYQERLYWHIRKIVLVHEDADDVLQNTFMKVWTGLQSFRKESQLYTWMYRIATNEALGYIKKNRKGIQLSIQDDSSPMIDRLESDEWFDGDDFQLKFQRALLELPDKQRLVFNMKYFDEMKYEDMADVLDTSVGALKASYHHAVKKLKKYLGDD